MRACTARIAHRNAAAQPLPFGMLPDSHVDAEITSLDEPTTSHVLSGCPRPCLRISQPRILGLSESLTRFAHLCHAKTVPIDEPTVLELIWGSWRVCSPKMPFKIVQIGDPRWV